MHAPALSRIVLIASIGMSALVAAEGKPKRAPEPAADDTAQNDADRNRTGAKPTADQAGNGKSDVELMAQIRRAIVGDKGLSVSAHNIKIVAERGVVTLKGPVKSAEEKKVVAKKAADVAGEKNVRNEIELAP